MSRRKRQSSLEFGSDSFLDIIANVVGILIILIVIVGVRVSRQPVVEFNIPTPEPVAVESLPSISEDTRKPPTIAPAQLIDPALTSAIISATEPPPLESPPEPVLPPAIAEPRPVRIVPPSQELLAAIGGTEKELRALQTRANEIAEAIKSLDAQSAEADRIRRMKEQELERVESETKDRAGRLAEIQREYRRLEIEFVGKQRELTDAEQESKRVEAIKHRFTPVSREVNGPEMHFHLKGGRVATVPLEQLIGRLKDQLQRQKSWLTKVRQHQGRIGPYRGFEVDYVVVRQSLSRLERAQLGYAAVRIVPVLLKFQPTDELQSEDARQALSAGSDFIRELRFAPPGATLTFWVYPDSFGLYRELKAFAHEEGFTVAARPLKTGDVITASPWGSKSAGQ
ncbi:hypothetical protein [Thalassoroseus pseudoceratinae]|uniref:hypothetical protein n=1 Tax=Thalassoroseus pseudoceratinae TaxID=2713176 RepID=UPI00141F8829|nr:hypothetical protein [Thalassoroseus pseudoceratinae]